MTATTSKSVIIVDDEEDIVDSLASVLEAGIENLSIHTASSGEAGLEILRRVPVDLVISDFRMPGMNGAEFLQHADALAPKARRIMISAFPESTLREQGADRARVDLFLPKPMEIDELIMSSRRLLGVK